MYKSDVTMNDLMSGDELDFELSPDEITQKENVVKEGLDMNSWWLTSLNRVSSFRYVDSLERPFLTSKNKEIRLKFANKHKEFDWKRVMFADEHTIRLGKSRIKLWTAITRDEIFDLKLVNKHFGSQTYIQEVLTPIIKPYKEQHQDVVFVHDNAPCHISRATKSWFKNHDIDVLPWPAQSSDLNLVENLWSSLRFQLDEMSDVKPRTFEDSAELINVAWQEVQDLYTSNFMEELYDSMSKRLQICINNNGNLIYK